MAYNSEINAMWDDNPVDVTREVNFIWSIANRLRGAYKSDKYKDVRRLLEEAQTLKGDALKTATKNIEIARLLSNYKAYYETYTLVRNSTVEVMKFLVSINSSKVLIIGIIISIFP